MEKNELWAQYTDLNNKKISIGVQNSSVELISDHQYHQTLRVICCKARRRIYASMFIVELLPDQDKAKDNKEIRPTIVVEFLEELRNAYLRGIDVRIIVGGSGGNIHIQDETEAAFAHCQKMRIPCRLAAAVSEKTCHKKVVVADDMILSGSHNWSYGAFSGQIQDSVLIQDPRMASYVASRIAQHWRLLDGGTLNEKI